MKTIFDHPAPEGDVARLINHWCIEDGESGFVDKGVIVEFFDSVRGPAMLATPFTRDYAPSPTISREQNDSLCFYSDTIPHHRNIMGALINGDIRGRFAQDAVLQLIHALFPAEWAKKYLPQVYEMLQSTC